MNPTITKVRNYIYKHSLFNYAHYLNFRTKPSLGLNKDLTKNKSGANIPIKNPVKPAKRYGSIKILKCVIWNMTFQSLNTPYDDNKSCISL